MLNCHKCIYKVNIRGKSHVKCSFLWKRKGRRQPQLIDSTKTKNFSFPYDFDPRLGDECGTYEEKW